VDQESTIEAASCIHVGLLISLFTTNFSLVAEFVSIGVPGYLEVHPDILLPGQRLRQSR
jgi:hypothetical protein